MVKKILGLIVLISFNLSAQNKLEFEQKWSIVGKLPFNIMDGLYFTKVDSGLYAEFEILQDESIFYPDIETSQKDATFFKINEALQLDIIRDTNLSKELFAKTDFRTEWSPFIHVERGYNSVEDPDGNWKHNWEISCQYDGETYTENFSYMSAPNRWYGVRSSLVSDESGLNAVFLGQSCLGEIFAKIYFIHFSIESKEFEIIEKDIKYADLGFNTSNIAAVTNYNSEFCLNNAPGMLVNFNLENSSAIGISTLLYDLEKNEVIITSKKLDNSELPILPEFNEVTVEIQVLEKSINYFINQYRCKISQGDEANTILDSESSEDILYLKYENGNFTENRNFRNIRKSFHLIKSIKLNDDFIFIYDKKPEGIQIDEEQIIGKDNEFKLWVVQFSEKKTQLYELGFDYKEINTSINESYISFTDTDNSSLEITVFLNSDLFEPTQDYLIGKINITCGKQNGTR